MYKLRDKSAAQAMMDLIVFQNPEAFKQGINPFDHGERHTEMWKTEGLKLALDLHKFDAAFGGARRDEEKARAKERFFSHRDDFGQWDPKNQRPELWNIFNGRKQHGEHFRIFPLSNWTEMDIWQYIKLESIELPNLYFSHDRECFVRNGVIMGVCDFIEIAKRCGMSIPSFSRLNRSAMC